MTTPALSTNMTYSTTQRNYGVNIADEGWHGAGHNSGNTILPQMISVPSRKRHVYVEYTNGLFIPKSMHDEVKLAEERKKASLMIGGQQVGGSAWDSQEDAKDYIVFMDTVRKFLQRVSFGLGGLVLGFSISLVTLIETDPLDQFQTFILYYSHFYFIEQKFFLLIGLIMAVIHPFRFAFELGTRQQYRRSVAQALAQSKHVKNSRLIAQATDVSAARPFGVTVGLSSQGGLGGSGMLVDYEERDDEERTQFMSMFYGSMMASPWRHFANIQYIGYIGALLCTIVVTSVIQNQTEQQVKGMVISDIRKLRIAFFLRTGFLAVAWLLSLKDFG
eukprot:Tbor_TRINITY_DN2256_c0_g1::TRINITY_DN2256_c0_g1_i1::g.2798::m.2798